MLNEKIIIMEVEWDEYGNSSKTLEHHSQILIKEVINFDHSKQCLDDWQDRLTKETLGKKVVKCAYYEKKETLI
jgi:hypothetical protein